MFVSEKTQYTEKTSKYPIILLMLYSILVPSHFAGIVKTYNLTFQETETLQAVFSKDLCPNHIVADAK